MRVPVQDSLAGKPAVPCRPQTGSALQACKIRMNCKVCTQKSSVCARMYPAETKEMQYQINKKSMYWYVLSTYQYIPFYEPEVCTGYILLTSSLYFKTYISYGKLHFFSEIFLDSENFLRKSQIFRLHFLRKSKSYLRKCNLVFFSLGARFRITIYASENYF